MTGVAVWESAAERTTPFVKMQLIKQRVERIKAGLQVSTKLLGPKRRLLLWPRMQAAEMIAL